MIEVRDTLADDAAQMPFTQNEDMIQAFAPLASNGALTDRIGVRCPTGVLRTPI